MVECKVNGHPMLLLLLVLLPLLDPSTASWGWQASKLIHTAEVWCCCHSTCALWPLVHYASAKPACGSAFRQAAAPGNILLCVLLYMSDCGCSLLGKNTASCCQLEKNCMHCLPASSLHCMSMTHDAMCC